MPPVSAVRISKPLRAFGACLIAGLIVACSPPEPKTEGAPRQLRRLTETQYRNSIADIFGADVKVAGRFEPIVRPRMELVAVGTSLAAISPAGFEQYDSMGRGIAEQVVDEAHRATLLPCAPKDAKAADADCARLIFTTIGRQLFRRPLKDDETDALLKVAEVSTKNMGDFYAGAAMGLAGILSSPHFLFRVEAVENDPARAGQLRFDGYSKAARLSYFLWNTTPDEKLLAAAERGELATQKGLDAQIDRMLRSPRLESGVRAFFADMLEFEKFDELAKDPVIYPKFNREIARDSQEQILRTAVSHLVDKDGDYRDLFTTRQTFMTRPLGVVYQMPVRTVSGWEPVELPQDSARAGIVTYLGFLAVNSHAGRSSPTLRGKALREVLLCQKVPDPPGDVDFTVVQDTDNSEFKTARSRLTAHRSNATCAGCHKLVDPIGLSLENFDGLGEFRATENGEVIDTSGDLDGVAFKDGASLGRAIHDNPATTSCLVKRMFEYAAGREQGQPEQELMGYLNKRFASGNYSIKTLMRTIAAGDAFFAVRASEAKAASLRQD